MADHGAAAAVRRAARRDATAAPGEARDDRLRARRRDPEAYRDHAQPGIERAAEPDSEIHRARGRGLDLPQPTTCPRRARPRATTSRRWCSSTRTPRSPTPTSAPRSGARSPTRRSRVVGCAGRDRRRSVAWWDGDVSGGPVVHRYGEHGGGELDAFAWADAARRPREVDAVAASCSCCRRGRCERCASTKSSHSASASTSTSAARARQAGPQGRHRRPARDPPPHARARRGPRRLGGGAHRAGREVGRAPPRRPAAPGRLEGARPAGRGRARRRAAGAYSDHSRREARSRRSSASSRR